MVDKTPATNPDSESSLYESEELYTPEQAEALGSTSGLELQIASLKRRISKELSDELERIQYELSVREYNIAVKEKALRDLELQLRARELEVTSREYKLAQIEKFESQKAPKEIRQDIKELRELGISDEELLDLEEEAEGLESTPEGLPPIGLSKQELRDYRANPPNPSGVGGLPGSDRSNAIVIKRDVYQGDRINLENGNSLVWNRQTNQYDDEFIPGDDPKINQNKGLKFTYFAVEAAYIDDKAGYDNPVYPHFYSQTIFGKQVWYERTPKNRKEDGLGPAYQGAVPLDLLIKLLNERVNTRLFTSDGKYIQNQDFRNAYKNYRMKYERGTYYKTKSNDLYSIIEPGSQVLEVKGNPPAFRTDARVGSPTYGERVATSTEERSRWSNSNSPFKGKSKRNKR